MKSFLIIGMGSFGHHLCRCLAEQKCEIMIVDECAERVEEMLPYAVSSKIGDCTNVEVLKSFGVKNFDACFVCIDMFQNSLEITSLLKELGAKKVFAKADRDVQAKFLLRNGADEVIYPERDVADRIAVRVSSENIFDCMALSHDHFIVEMQVPEKWVGRSVGEINVRAKYSLSVLAIKRESRVTPLTSADEKFLENDHLMVLGHIQDIRKLTK